MIQILVKESADFWGERAWVGKVLGFATAARSTISKEEAAAACARAYYADDLARLEKTPVPDVFQAFEKGEE